MCVSGSLTDDGEYSGLTSWKFRDKAIRRLWETVQDEIITDWRYESEKQVIYLKLVNKQTNNKTCVNQDQFG